MPVWAIVPLCRFHLGLILLTFNMRSDKNAARSASSGDSCKMINRGAAAELDSVRRLSVSSLTYCTMKASLRQREVNLICISKIKNF